MANLLHQFMLELMPWLQLLLLPLFLLLLRNSMTTNTARKKQQPDEDDDDHLPLPPPPSPPALPVLGHLHLIGSLPHVSLRNLAAKHGSDIMLLRLGAMPVLVVSSPRAAEAVLRTHDHLFASRPHSMAAEVILYGPSDIGFAPYGDHWRKARKLVTTHLLTVRRVQSFRHAREEEVSTVMAQIADAAAVDGAAVDVGKLLGSFMNDLVCRAVMGKASGRIRSKLFRKLVADTSPLLGGFNVEEFFPFLARFGVLSKVVRAKSARLRKRWDELLDGLIDDHESLYEPMAASELKEEDENFVHILLSVRQEYGLTRESMKAILLDVFFGGIDTSASLLEYTIIELIQRPHVMKKLQAEVRSSLPQGQDIVKEADLHNMPYLKAVIKESLRLHTVAPLLAPHLSMAGCAIDGLAVPAGVRVLINVWAIARDVRFWGEDAEEFVPERFLDGGSAADVGFRGTDSQFLPFGAGRRQCPGINFGMAAVEVMLANLVRNFDWEMPPPSSDLPADGSLNQVRAEVVEIEVQGGPGEKELQSPGQAAAPSVPAPLLLPKSTQCPPSTQPSPDPASPMQIDHELQEKAWALLPDLAKELSNRREQRALGELNHVRPVINPPRDSNPPGAHHQPASYLNNAINGV